MGECDPGRGRIYRRRAPSLPACVIGLGRTRVLRIGVLTLSPPPLLVVLASAPLLAFDEARGRGGRVLHQVEQLVREPLESGADDGRAVRLGQLVDPAGDGGCELAQ